MEHALKFFALKKMVLHFKAFGSFWVSFCIGWEVEIKFHASTCGHPVFPTTFVKETVLFSMYVFGSFGEN
jgi:hypothetical protein